MKADVDVEAIKRRWATTDPTLKWHGIPAERRQRVLAELEENAREATARDSLLASDLRAAVDALDVPDNAALLDLLTQARADIRGLLQQLR